MEKLSNQGSRKEIVCSFTYKYFHDPHDFNVYSSIITYHILKRGLRPRDVLYDFFCSRVTLAKDRFQGKKKIGQEKTTIEYVAAAAALVRKSSFFAAAQRISAVLMSNKTLASCNFLF